MIEKQQFKALADKIILSVYNNQKDQQLLYKQEGNEWIESLYSNRPIEENEIKISLEGGASIKDVIEWMSVITATFKMIKDVYTLIKGESKNKKNISIDVNSIKDTWKKKLIDEKIDEKTAERIATEFSVELNQFL